MSEIITTWQHVNEGDIVRGEGGRLLHVVAAYDLSQGFHGRRAFDLTADSTAATTAPTQRVFPVNESAVAVVARGGLSTSIEALRVAFGTVERVPPIRY